MARLLQGQQGRRHEGRDAARHGAGDGRRHAGGLGLRLRLRLPPKLQRCSVGPCSCRLPWLAALRDAGALADCLQTEFTHEVPRVSVNTPQGAGQRINITIRAFKPVGSAAAAAGRAAGKPRGSASPGGSGGSRGSPAKRQRKQ